MSISSSEAYVKKLLEALGLTVSKIQEPESHKIADLSAIDNKSNQYIVEVKSQSEDDEYLKELEEQGKVTRKDEVLRTNVASGVVCDAAEQLRQTPAPEDSFNLIAIIPSSDDPGTQISEFLSTLYGIVPLIQISEDRKPNFKDCFYFDYNDYFRLPNVNATMLFSGNTCQLCLNSFAENSTFKKSVLFDFFRQGNGIIDPLHLESTGNAYIADTDIKRLDENALVDYIVNKYSLSIRPIPYRPNQLRGAIRIDSELFD